jgi:hypothetical protein
MKNYKIILKNNIDKKELILHLYGTDLNDLLKKMEFISFNGGQFTWGYDKKSNRGKIIISFKKVKLTAEGEIVKDDEENFSRKCFLAAVMNIILMFLGLYYFIHNIVNLWYNGT